MDLGVLVDLERIKAGQGADSLGRPWCEEHGTSSLTSLCMQGSHQGGWRAGTRHLGFVIWKGLHGQVWKVLQRARGLVREESRILLHPGVMCGAA